jgi:hypothetical protein
MKKTYQKPTLVRRENLAHVAAIANNGNVAFFSTTVREVLIDNA